MNVDIKIGDFLFSRSCFRKTYTTNTGVGYFHLARMIGMNIVDDDIECTIELLDGTIQTCMYSNTSGNYRTCNIPYYDFFKKEKYRLYEEENDWKDKSKSFVIRTDYRHFPVLKHCEWMEKGIYLYKNSSLMLMLIKHLFHFRRY